MRLVSWSAAVRVRGAAAHGRRKRTGEGGRGRRTRSRSDAAFGAHLIRCDLGGCSRRGALVDALGTARNVRRWRAIGWRRMPALLRRHLAVKRRSQPVKLLCEKKSAKNWQRTVRCNVVNSPCHSCAATVGWAAPHQAMIPGCKPDNGLYAQPGCAKFRQPRAGANDHSRREFYRKRERDAC